MKKEPYYIVRNSKIHGKGVFAKRPIRKGTKVVEYTGTIVSREEADEIGTSNVSGHTHTMLFTIDDDRVIDGNVGGDARFINHGCDPNCEAVQYDDKIFIESIRSVKKGEELTYDYHLQVPGKITDKVKEEYVCYCGSPKCRGTQIAQEILDKQAKKDAKKKAKEEKKAADEVAISKARKKKKTKKKNLKLSVAVDPKKKDKKQKDKKKKNKKK
ncbi:MAG: SET domain-containing protein-lysine N-methyltransferase [Bacteroidota bacterium]|nr:SET domain-containing protein-lysine N-methyltransferase [Bacteroidota bacterium]